MALLDTSRIAVADPKQSNSRACCRMLYGDLLSENRSWWT